MPAYPVAAGRTVEQELQGGRGCGTRQERLAPAFASAAGRHAATGELYIGRVSRAELATICQMGFAGYFLIVADFIRWARENGVPVGPGRGSGAGSLVAYVLANHRSRPAAATTCCSSAS